MGWGAKITRSSLAGGRLGAKKARREFIAPQCEQAEGGREAKRGDAKFNSAIGLETVLKLFEEKGEKRKEEGEEEEGISLPP